MDEVSVHLGSRVDVVSDPRHRVLLACVIILHWAVDLASKYKCMAADHDMLSPALTMCLGGLGPDMVTPGPGVLPQELLRGVEAGLGLAHGQVRLLARGEFISHLIVILRLEPGKMTH